MSRQPPRGRFRQIGRLTEPGHDSNTSIEVTGNYRKRRDGREPLAWGPCLELLPDGACTWDAKRASTPENGFKRQTCRYWPIQTSAPPDLSSPGSGPGSQVCARWKWG